MKRNISKTVRIEKELYELIKQEANEQGLNSSELIRKCIIEQLNIKNFEYLKEA